MTNNELKKALQTIIEKSPEISLEKEVATEALEYGNISNFFSDLSRFGCVSGMISNLIYYTDSHEFFDTHYDQIEELRREFEDNTGIQINIKGDLKNDFAWFAFEITASRMTTELGLDF